MIKHLKNCNSWDILFNILSTNDKFLIGKSILQIGVKKKSYGVHNWLKMFKIFKEFGYTDFDVMDVWKPNLDNLEYWEYLGDKILGNINNIDKLITKQYNIILFWHGIEHLEKNEFSILQSKLDLLSGTILIMGCPYGEFKQGEVDGNPYEEHKTHWQPEELESFGYDIFTTDFENRKDIIGIKYIE